MRTPAFLRGWDDPRNRKEWRNGTLVYTLSGIITLFFLLLMGDFAWSLRERSIFQIVQLMFKTHKASDFVNAVMITALPGVLGFFLGPVISYRSDRTRSRWGRRIPYLFFATPVATGALFGLGISVKLGNWLHALTNFGVDRCILIFLGLFWTIFEIAAVISGVMFAALVNDVVPAEFLGRFYGLFRAVSLAAGIIFNYWLFGYAELHSAVLFFALGAINFIGFTILCCKVREGEYPEPEHDAAHPGVFHAVKNYFQECYSDPHYLRYYVFNTLCWLTILPVNAFSLFHAKNLGVDMGDYGKYNALVYLISLLLSYFLGMLADRFHPLRLTIAVMGIYCLETLLAGVLINTPLRFACFFIAHSVLVGTYLTVSASLGLRLLPKSKFAQFSSAGTLPVSFFSVLLIMVLGKVLDHLNHQYTLTYLLASCTAFLAVLAGLVLYRSFVRHGGIAAYRAPEADVHSL